jgi:hypothetical protein
MHLLLYKWLMSVDAILIERKRNLFIAKRMILTQRMTNPIIRQ